MTGIHYNDNIGMMRSLDFIPEGGIAMLYSTFLKRLSAFVLAGLISVGGYAAVGASAAGNNTAAAAASASETALVNQSAVSASSITIGQNLVIYGRSSGGSGSCKYAYYYKKSNESKWTTIRDLGTAVSVLITPPSTGTYNICVKVKDAAGTVAKKYIDVKVLSGLQNNSTVSRTSIDLGQTVTVSGKASGGSGGYIYSYYYKKESDSKWTIISERTSQTSVSAKPAKSTKYNFCIKVLDSNGALAKKYIDVNVGSALVNKSTLSKTSLTVSQQTVIYGKASGGSGTYSYTYYYKAASENNWTALTSSDDKKSAVFKPTKAATYDICAKTTDTNGMTVKKYFSVTVSPALVNQCSVSSRTLTKGDTLTLYGRATGGSGGYTYAYYYKSATNSTWTEISGFSSEQTVAVKMNAAGDYNFCIKVHDSNGAESKVYMDVTVKASQLTNTSAISATQVNAGTSVKITLSAQNASGSCTYTVYQREGSGQWSALISNTTSATLNISMNYTGSYQFRVVATDSSGATAEKILSCNVVSAESQSEQQIIAQILSQIITSGMDDFDKARAIHDWLVCNTEYDTAGLASGNIPQTSYTTYGLLTTHKAVCDGYAKAFVAMANQAGLSAVRVTGIGYNGSSSGESHAWNQVRISGVWYNVDVTWDDPIMSNNVNNSNLRYTYFLIPDSVMYQDHTPDSAPYTCTAAQPMHRIADAAIDDALDADPTCEYCESTSELSAAMRSFDNRNISTFCLIYKKDGTLSEALSDVIGAIPSGHGAQFSYGEWKLPGYYCFTVTLT